MGKYRVHGVLRDFCVLRCWKMYVTSPLLITTDNSLVKMLEIDWKGYMRIEQTLRNTPKIQKVDIDLLISWIVQILRNIFLQNCNSYIDSIKSVVVWDYKFHGLRLEIMKLQYKNNNSAVSTYTVLRDCEFYER